MYRFKHGVRVRSRTFPEMGVGIAWAERWEGCKQLILILWEGENAWVPVESVYRDLNGLKRFMAML